MTPIPARLLRHQVEDCRSRPPDTARDRARYAYLLEAGQSIFIAHGRNGVAIRELSDATGLAQYTIRRLVSDVDHLFQLILTRHLDAVLNAICRVPIAAPDQGARRRAEYFRVTRGIMNIPTPLHFLLCRDRFTLPADLLGPLERQRALLDSFLGGEAWEETLTLLDCPTLDLPAIEAMLAAREAAAGVREPRTLHTPEPPPEPPEPDQPPEPARLPNTTFPPGFLTAPRKPPFALRARAVLPPQTPAGGPIAHAAEAPPHEAGVQGRAHPPAPDAPGAPQPPRAQTARTGYHPGKWPKTSSAASTPSPPSSANAPTDIARLYFTADAKYEVGPYCAALAKLRRPYRELPPEEMQKAAGTAHHGGIAAVAEARPVPFLEVENPPQTKLLLVLDQIGNPHNLGAIVRSAAFFGVDSLLFHETRQSAGPSDAAYRTAEGAFELPVPLPHPRSGPLPPGPDPAFPPRRHHAHPPGRPVPNPAARPSPGPGPRQ